jgi:hypothetical protein
VGPAVTAVILSFLTGLTASKWLYEAAFPQALLLARPLPVFLMGAATAVLGGYLYRRLEWRYSGWLALLPFLPLAVATPYLLQTADNLAYSQIGPLPLRRAALEEELELRLDGYGSLAGLEIELAGAVNRRIVVEATNERGKTTTRVNLGGTLPDGRYQLRLSYPGEKALCGWLARPSDGCIWGELEVKRP